MTISRRAIEKFKQRYPNLVELGLMDDSFVAALLAANALHCRPCDVGAVTIDEARK